MRPIFIYALVSTRDINDPHYIGQSVDALDRTKHHLACLPSPTRKGSAADHAAYEWMREECKVGYDIEVRVVEETPGDKDTADQRERQWIDKLRVAGYKLCNSTKGNRGRTPEQREKILAANRQQLEQDRAWVLLLRSSN